MKIGICDDFAKDRECIKNYCMDLGYGDVHTYSSGEELLDSPEHSSLNLLFLDIELDGINGIQIKNMLERTNPSTFIVFSTTHHELMPDAFGRSVINFLTKPYSEHSIDNCIKRAAFLDRDYYPISIDEATTLPCRDILYLYTDQKYTIFYTEDGTTFSTRKPLKVWAEELKDLGFCPISRSAIINLKHYIKPKNKQAILSGNISLPISRRYKSTLESRFDTYILNMTRFGR